MVKKIIITSGYFNPLHIGHLNLLRDAAKRGDFLIVIVNNDEQVKIKGSALFMPEQERLNIIKDLRYVDAVFLSIDKDESVAETLKEIAAKFSGKLFFAKGGDRNINNIPDSEKKICQNFNIEIINNVGGDKIQSSSWLINNLIGKTDAFLKKVGILGFGEVGRAIAKFYQNPKIKDLNRDDGLKEVDILHVCIPWSDSFSQEVSNQISQINPKLTIIHSTIAPGTTKQLAERFSGMVVHSPVRGMHPDLYTGIKTFVKYIGADNPSAGRMAKEHLENLGIKTKLFASSITTELGKLFDTTYYGLNIAWHGEMKKLCDLMQVNFDEAVTDFNETYNEGYTILGKKNVVRPVLKAPNPYIGGKCILQNAKLLNKYLNSSAIDLILKYDPK